MTVTPSDLNSHSRNGAVILNGNGSDPAAKERSKAEQLVRLALEDGAELFHDPERRPWATVPVGDHRETMALDSRGFAHWLGRGAHETGVASRQAITDAIERLKAQALYEGAEHPVYTRLAAREQAIYLDLGDASWRAIEICPEGWRVLVEEPPVKFRRPPSLRALPVPTSPGSVEALRPFLALEEEQWRLLVGWLVGCLAPSGPYPVLVLHGEQGSGKSTTAWMLRSLIDPAYPEHRAPPETERDLMIAATNARVVAFDNLSAMGGRNAFMSDALCRLSTGGGYATRALYSNDEEQLFEVQRPVILNGIDALPHRSDLLSRSLLIELPRLADSELQTERDLKQGFLEMRPRILGGLLDAAACALAHRDAVSLPVLPRMADHVVWVTAAAGALGWEAGSYAVSYAASRDDATDAALEASPLWPHIVELADGVARTAQELLDELGERAGADVTKQKRWPATPNLLSNHLKRLAPDLRRIGIEVERGTGGRDVGRRKTIALVRVIDPIDPIDPTALLSQKSGSTADSDAGTGSTPEPDGVDWGRLGSMAPSPKNPENTGMGSMGSMGSTLSETEGEGEG